MAFSAWLAFFSASVLVVVVPGPTLIVVLGYAVALRKRAIVPAVVGVAMGHFIAMGLGLIGFGAVLLASHDAATNFTFAGAGLLIVLGLNRIFPLYPRRTLHLVVDGNHCWRAFVNILSVTAVNPASVLFFFAVLPQFIDPARSMRAQTALMLGTFIALSLANVFAHVALTNRLCDMLRNPSVGLWLSRAGGAALILLGIATILARRVFV